MNSDVEEKSENALSIQSLYKSKTALVYPIDWKYAPTLNRLKNELSTYKSYTDAHMRKVNVWRNYRDGKINFITSANKSKVVRKVIKRSNSWKYPSLTEPFLSNINLFSLDPATADNTGYVQMATILNYQFTKEMDRVAFIEKYIRLTGDEGTAIIKPTWDYTPITEVKKVNLIDHTIVEGESVLKVEEDNVTATIMSTKTLRNTFNAEFCDLDSIFTHPSCKGDIGKSPAVIHRFVSTMSELFEDGRYSNIANISEADLGASDEQTGNFVSTDLNDSDIPSREVTVYEYWGKYDVDGDGMSENIVIAWVGNTIIRMDDNPYPLQEMPFISVKGIDDSDSIYGSTDADLLMDIQDLTSAINRGIVDTLGRTAIGQVINVKGAFDTIELGKLQNGESCEINTGHSIRDAFHTVSYPDLPMGAYQYLQSLDSEAEAITGVIGFGQGISGRTLGDSATAARATTDSVGVRTIATLRRLEEGLSKLARKAIRLNIEHLTDEDILRITGEDRTFERDQFIPLTYVTIEVSTPELNAAKSSKINFMFQTVGPQLDTSAKYSLLAKMARLDNMEDLAHVFENYEEPQPSEHDIATQKAELALLQAEGNEKNARAEYYRAMIKRTDSDTDLLDNEFIKDVNGTTHERDLEKVKASKDTGNTVGAATGLELPRLKQ